MACTLNFDRYLEKFVLAVNELAVGPGDVRSRLVEAYLHIVVLTNKEIPETLQADFRWILHEMTKFEPSDWYKRLGFGRIHATMERIRNKTGSRIAERIVYVEERLRTICGI